MFNYCSQKSIDESILVEAVQSHSENNNETFFTANQFREQYQFSISPKNLFETPRHSIRSII